MFVRKSWNILSIKAVCCRACGRNVWAKNRPWHTLTEIDGLSRLYQKKKHIGYNVTQKQQSIAGIRIWCMKIFNTYSHLYVKIKEMTSSCYMNRKPSVFVVKIYVYVHQPNKWLANDSMGWLTNHNLCRSRVLRRPHTNVNIYLNKTNTGDIFMDDFMDCLFSELSEWDVRLANDAKHSMPANRTSRRLFFNCYIASHLRCPLVSDLLKYEIETKQCYMRKLRRLKA